MEKKTLFKVLPFLLCLSYVVYAAAVPATRSTLARKMDPFVPYDQAKGDLVKDLRNSEELFDMKEGLEDGRVMMDVTDYPPTGPNHSHTPKPPAKP